jgi:putative transposase
MPRGLIRIHGGGNLHFITTSCYRREPLLGSVRARDVFLEIFEQVRKGYGFEVIGFVVMPEHIPILISEPKRKTIPIVMQVLKQRVGLRLLPKRRPRAQREFWETLRRHFWQPRSYDFNVYSDRKVTEKLRYMHRNVGAPNKRRSSTPQSNGSFVGTPVFHPTKQRQLCGDPGVAVVGVIVRCGEDWFLRLSCGGGAAIGRLLSVSKER